MATPVSVLQQLNSRLSRHLGRRLSMVRPKRWQAIFEPGHRAQLRQAGNSLLTIWGPALF